MRLLPLISLMMFVACLGAAVIMVDKFKTAALFTLFYFINQRGSLCVHNLTRWSVSLYLEYGKFGIRHHMGNDCGILSSVSGYEIYHVFVHKLHPVVLSFFSIL